MDKRRCFLVAYVSVKGNNTIHGSMWFCTDGFPKMSFLVENAAEIAKSEKGAVVITNIVEMSERDYEQFNQ